MVGNPDLPISGNRGALPPPLIINFLKLVRKDEYIPHENPKKCAEMHCDKHIVKMPVETAQMLSTANLWEKNPNLLSGNSQKFQI